jgi:hypothetical protein
LNQGSGDVLAYDVRKALPRRSQGAGKALRGYLLVAAGLLQGSSLSGLIDQTLDGSLKLLIRLIREPGGRPRFDETSNQNTAWARWSIASEKG